MPDHYQSDTGMIVTEEIARLPEKYREPRTWWVTMVLKSPYHFGTATIYRLRTSAVRASATCSLTIVTNVWKNSPKQAKEARSAECSFIGRFMVQLGPG